VYRCRIQFVLTMTLRSMKVGKKVCIAYSLGAMVNLILNIV